MRCRLCKRGEYLFFVTTRRYMAQGGVPLPIVVSYYKCSNPKCKSVIGAEHRKSHFCRVCGILTNSTIQLCEICQRKRPDLLKLAGYSQ